MDGLRKTHSRLRTSRGTTTNGQRQHWHITASKQGIEHAANQHGRRTVTSNAESPSPLLERVEDLFAVERASSCRLSRLRRCKKAVKVELTGGSQ